MRLSPGTAYERLPWALWLVLLVCIPITSLPLLSQGSAGETPVGPASLLPLLALVVVWLVPYLVRGGRLPGIFRPLLGFAVVAVVSAAAASLLPLLPYKGQTPVGRELRALVTLAIGLSFYVCASLLPDTEGRRRDSVRAIYVGCGVMLAWASVQGWFSLIQAEKIPLWMTRLHHMVSVRDLLVGRVGGFAYEPSWLGNQLMVLYIPLLSAAVIERQSVFPFRRGWASIESILLLWSVGILALTKSRISQVTLLALIAAFILVVGGRGLAAAERRLGWKPPSGWNPRRVATAVVNGAVLIALVAGLVMAAGTAAASSDERLWALESLRDRLEESRHFYPNEVAFALSDRLAFAERLVYWTAAFRAFSLYPLLGVGPGNAGFLFEQTVPDYGLRLTEIRNLLVEVSYGFPNPKNLWARLLAETGLIGFVFFAWWLISVGLAAAVLWRRGRGFQRYLGLAALIAVLAQVVEGFSLDTYALPQMWIVFGLATAALRPEGEQDPAAGAVPFRREASSVAGWVDPAAPLKST